MKETFFFPFLFACSIPSLALFFPSSHVTTTATHVALRRRGSALEEVAERGLVAQRRKKRITRCSSPARAGAEEEERSKEHSIFFQRVEVEQSSKSNGFFIFLFFFLLILILNLCKLLYL